MCKEIIPIVYASDENFLWQTYTSIFSVLINRTKEYWMKFYVLVPEDCKQKQYNKNWDFKYYSIEYRYVSSKYFQNVKMVLQNISKPTYYRLLIPNLLPEYDKCLYLDGDTICCKDIYELYKLDVGNNLLAAGMGANLPFDASYWEKVLEIPNAIHYINAGVLLFNLKQMRMENKVSDFLICSKRKLPCQDQDVLNICCYNRIKILPLKYNVYSNAFNMPLEMLLERFEEKDIQEAFEKPVIIHYPGEFAKPWNNPYCVKGEQWWKYAEQGLGNDFIEKERNMAAERIKRYDYHILFQRIENSNKIVVFGFSEIGKKFCDQANEKYPGKVVCFCDNSQEKLGESYQGYKVETLETIKKRYSNVLFVITSQNYSNVIEKQLLEGNISLANIAIYRKKTQNYIYCMDSRYWEDVKREICLDTISWDECFETMGALWRESQLHEHSN